MPMQNPVIADVRAYPSDSVRAACHSLQRPTRPTRALPERCQGICTLSTLFQGLSLLRLMLSLKPGPRSPRAARLWERREPELHFGMFSNGGGYCVGLGTVRVYR